MTHGAWKGPFQVFGAGGWYGGRPPACSTRPQRSPTAARGVLLHPFTKGSIRRIQELLGHSNVKPTMIDSYVLNRGPPGVRSRAGLL